MEPNEVGLIKLSMIYSVGLYGH